MHVPLKHPRYTAKNQISIQIQETAVSYKI